MRIIVHTGKGGVGKTSVSAATALHCAEMGLKTIVISTDTAHSLGDSLDREIGPEPIEIRPNLWAQEVDARYSMDKYWGAFQKYMIALFSRRGVEDIVAEEVTILPGFEEGAHLLWIDKYVREGFYDMLIVDAAPTAETLRLLSLPDVSRWWFERLIKLTRGMSRVLRPIAKPLLRTELPNKEAFDTVEALFKTLDNVRALLADPTMSSMRLVVNPEKMVIKETQRTYTYLNLYGYAVDAVICNKILPEAVTDPYFQQWKDLQRENIALIQEVFGELPLLKAPMMERDVSGLEGLRHLADNLYTNVDPTKRLFHGTTHEIIAQGKGGYLLRVPLPFAHRDDLDLYRSADEITLRVGPYRRNIVLPHAL
ncbi:MAG TPA: TRC40/GET3/ArsA family transport-energizing ATPase, partial [Aggregatilineales bacterium]|nr:TRC40/GET3/ArsA family transport-energizing ATPase [Aggregatilineales bacterium]